MSVSPAFADTLTRRRLVQGIGAGAALLGLAGCRSAVDQDKAAPAGAQAGPRRGGTLKVATLADLTPALLFTQGPIFSIHRLVFNTLTRYAPGGLDPQPELATAWQIAPDGKAITLTLREDVTFHNGRPFTAEDVVFAVRNLQNPQRSAQLRATALAVTGFDIDSPHRITLRLAHPVTNIFDLFEFMVISAKESVEDAVLGRNVVGTGPFVWKTWTPGTSLVLERNPRYWVPERPYLDAVEIRVVPQPDALIASLRSGQSHLAAGLGGRDIAPLREDKAFNLREYDQGSGNIYLGVNTSVAPLDDKRVRQALSFAVNRDRIVKQALGGYGLASAAPWPKTSPVYTDADANRYPYDPTRAKALLAEAGHGGGLDLPLAFLSTAPAVAQMVQFDLAQVGVKTTLEPLDPAKFQAQLIAQTMPALWTGTHGFASNQPATLAVSAYPFNEAKNTSKFTDPQYTEIVQRAWNQTDARSAAAKAAYAELSQALLDRQFIIDLAVLTNVQPATANLRDVRQNRYNATVLDDAYLAG
ncbi:ABC transporter substrate-binding protein [Embleya scabrispora]|uniref:ABC transporter substrate-binding protein n=1 Tax=Embleya scabrispora TaxID=159449 RepID=UPI00036C5C4D|nr:ABC transporter substrate-binding protein [Embleya scabrispora]MYS87268.1 ABC transporter substrate-binding protein [Streptomyces sp. SID5474]